MVLDNSAEQLKQSQECRRDFVNDIEKQSEVDGNAMMLDGTPPKALAVTDANASQSVSDGTPYQGEADSNGVSQSPGVCINNTINYGSIGGELKQSQGVTKRDAKGVGKPVKRKRASLDGNGLSTDKGSLVAECCQELDRLLEYYKELSGHMLELDAGMCSSNNSLVACLLEERSMSYSKLVEVIYEKLKGKEGFTLAYVRGAVLSVGQRTPYGITNAEADVLEDESESCLWCWETRDIKLLPMNHRGELNVRRIGRKKIHERISALSATLSALAIPENQDTQKNNLRKTSMMLGKTLNVEEIRSLVEKKKQKKQKNDTGMAEKTVKQKEKEAIREIQKEKLQTEKEIKRMQEEAEKDAKRREKEEAESKRQLKKQQEEAERDQRRRERAEAELKEKRSVKKQATIMERFLKAKKSNSNSHNVEQFSIKNPTCDSSCKVEVANATSLMDIAFSGEDNIALEDLRKLHSDGWRKLSCCNRSCHWGVRRNPKTELFKKLKLHESSTVLDPFRMVETLTKEAASCKDSMEPSLSKHEDDGSEQSFVNIRTDISSLLVRLLSKKLLQFDKSNRPAYYGTWSKKSHAVGPRHPFKKDPDLDYDVDSDEEWEEEEPGESLSDCEKDADEERLEEENLKLEDEEESEDDFFVPDGYLSEDEGVQADNTSDVIGDVPRSSHSDRPEVEIEDVRVLMQQQKYLQNLTEQALRKCHPLVILNLMHEKSEVRLAEDTSGTCKIEQMCLQALCMQACTGDYIVDISIDHCRENEDQDVPTSQNRNTTPSHSTTAIPDSDLPEIVSSIRSNSQGINKVLESLQGKFPTIPKSQLKNKVKEISDYVDNRWQVKKEVLDRLGLSTSPDDHAKPKGIATFFSKRCLPLDMETIRVAETSPEQSSKCKVLPGDAPSAAVHKKG